MIRGFRPEDTPAVVDIANRAWRVIHDSYRRIYGAALFDILVPSPETRKGKQVAGFCERRPEQVFVCEEDGCVVGFVTFSIDRERGIGEICNNAVDPDCGLKGRGQQMYKAVLDLFRREGLRYAAVGTGSDEGHARARRAYERAGFDISAPSVRYYMKL